MCESIPLGIYAAWSTYHLFGINPYLWFAGHWFIWFILDYVQLRGIQVSWYCRVYINKHSSLTVLCWLQDVCHTSPQFRWCDPPASPLHLRPCQADEVQSSEAEDVIMWLSQKQNCDTWSTELIHCCRRSARIVGMVVDSCVRPRLFYLPCRLHSSALVETSHSISHSEHCQNCCPGFHFITPWLLQVHVLWFNRLHSVQNAVLGVVTGTRHHSCDLTSYHSPGKSRSAKLFREKLICFMQLN